jgi:hypothetical protein
MFFLGSAFLVHVVTIDSLYSITCIVKPVAFVFGIDRCLVYTG